MIQVGDTVGNYKITAKLGEGGMGVVFLAEHPVIGRKVAIKAIHPELSRNPEVVSRFMTEAKSVNQIGNEHIVDISDFGNTPDGEFFFVMEFLQGEALADRLKRERVFAAPRALKIAAQVADALGASHEHGIVHRDLKPENIYLITRGTNTDFVKVLDFGLAKLTQGEDKVSHKTRTGSVMGTPYYMAPEQCEGKANVDHRADVYALGVILFEMLTGKVPFGGEGYGEIIVKHITAAPPSIRAINPGLTEAHEAIVQAALTKDRDKRFQTMADFRAAMLDPEAFLATSPLPASERRATVHPGAKGGDQLSGQVVFDAGNAGEELGAQRGKLPTTFRQQAGELLEDEMLPQKSRKGLVLGVVGAAALAGLAGFFVMRGGSAPTEAAKPAAAEPQQPDKPEKVTITFHSEPSGAQVILKSSGEKLCETPCDKELPYGEEPVEFVFSKDGFESRTKSLAPKMAALVESALPAAKATEPPAGDDKDATKDDRKPKPVSIRGKTGRDNGKRDAVRKPNGPSRVLDEDAVLEPTFR